MSGAEETWKCARSGVTDLATAPPPHFQGLHATSCTPTTGQHRWSTTCFLLEEMDFTSWLTPRGHSGVQKCLARAAPPLIVVLQRQAEFKALPSPAPMQGGQLYEGRCGCQ